MAKTLKTQAIRALALAGLLLLALSRVAAAEAALTPYSAEYKVKIAILSGSLTTELRAAGDGYQATHIVRPRGLAKLVRDGSIHEQSHFSAIDDGIRATWYRSVDTLSKKSPSAEVSFDWSASEMSGTVNGEEVRTALDGLVHDRVAIQYQLMLDLMNGTASDRYVLFDIDEFKTLLIRNLGEREVKTPAGRFQAIGIQHQKENSSRVTTLWCVPELDYLPVLIEQHKDGKLRLRAQLKNYLPLDT